MTTYSCACGGTHDYTDVDVAERLARAVDIPNNVNKYYRIVRVEAPCGKVVFLTHSGRWTDGWRDRGAWKKAQSAHEAHEAFQKKVRGEYRHTDQYGEFTGANGNWNGLVMLETLTGSERRRANAGAVAAQSFAVALTQAELMKGAATPAPAPKPSPVKPGLDPLLDLTRRTDTLVTQLATSDFTADHAIERAKLLSEINDYRQRLMHVESTLEIATALIASKS